MPRRRCPASRGVFGADTQVASVNDGPMTLILDREPVAATEHDLA